MDGFGVTNTERRHSLQLEDADDFFQVSRLILQGLRCGSRFFNQGCILLGRDDCELCYFLSDGGAECDSGSVGVGTGDQSDGG